MVRERKTVFFSGSQTAYIQVSNRGVNDLQPREVDFWATKLSTLTVGFRPSSTVVDQNLGLSVRSWLSDRIG